jgi:hypothetical protein
MSPAIHGMSQDGLDSLDSRPLGALALSRHVELLVGSDEQTGIFGVPYLQHWSTLPKRLSHVGGANLVATHAPIFPPGDEPPYDFINAEDWALMVRPVHRHSGRLWMWEGSFVADVS